MKALRLRAGELVRVRRPEEILATLDDAGRLDALPFMLEMLKHCGKTYRVAKRADRTCDTITSSGMRRMRDTVHLEDLRCDGAAHGGCQATCLLFFKEAWLERAPAGAAASTNGHAANGHASNGHAPAPEGAVEARLAAGARATAPDGATDEVFVCQATQLYRATTPMTSWDPRHYLRDIRSGTVTVRQALRAMFWQVFAATLQMRGYRLQLWLFNTVQRLRGGGPFPFPQGRLTKTPSRRLDLPPGQTVRVRRLAEIEATLDVECRNRGLSFDVEMTKFCGGTYRVARRIERIINERTGRMMRLPSDCLVLEGVVCDGRYHWACSRAIPSYWREIWLERVGSDAAAHSNAAVSPTPNRLLT